MNVVVVHARGLRADFLGCYGNLWIDTPNLDQLACESVLFDWHFADFVGQDAVGRGWQSGRYDFAGTGPKDFDLLTQLRAAGIVTWLVCDTAADLPAGFITGWQEVMEAKDLPGADALERTLAASEDCLGQLVERSGWLLWLDFATTRPPWSVPQDFLDSYFQQEPDEDDEEREPLEPLLEPALGDVDPNDDRHHERLQSTCAAAVSYFDAGIGLIMACLREAERADDTLVIVTSDTGFPLGERGLVGSAGSLPHEELIHVPLLMRLPGAKEAGRRVSALTQPVDLAPTLALMFGLTIPEAHGRDLGPLLRGEADAVRKYAVSGTASGGWCLRTPQWALLIPAATGQPPRLYVKPEDRSEVNDLSAHHLEWAESLVRLLGDFREAARQPGPLRPPPLPPGPT